MAITNFAELQTSVADFAHRNDLTSVMPDLVRLAEDVIYADLDTRQQDTLATLTCVANTETVALPADFILFRSLSLNLTSRKETLTYLTPTQYAQEFQSDYKAEPRAYTVIGSTLYLQPTPDSAYKLNAVYEAKLTNLSVSNTTNWLLMANPSVYLYAVLTQVAIYSKNTEDLTKWSNLYNKVIQGLNLKGWASGNAMQVRHDVNLTNIRL